MTKSSTIRLLAVVLLPAFFLGACEGKFTGDRELDLEAVNGPYSMHVVSVGGSSYLGILNTNYRFHKKGGSLQFYSLAIPQSPVRNDVLTIELPSNVADFLVDGTTLYLLDRDKPRVRVYDFDGTAFQERLDSKGDPVVIKVSDNPQSIYLINRATAPTKVLAVVSQLGGTIHFIQTDPLAYLADGPARPESIAPDVRLTNGVPGARLRMIPRQEESPGSNDKIDLSFSEKLGQGINGLVYLGGAHETFVTASFTSNGLFNFRFATFENSSNLAWDLRAARRGATYDDGTVLEGSDEKGFRGLAADDIGNVYATSRADNRLYIIPRTEFEREYGPDSRNTRGYPRDNQTHTSEATFDTNISDEIFPRLGDIVVETGTSAAATRAWILAFGTGSVYRVDLTNNAVTESAVLGEFPQKLIWNSTSNLLYVAVTKSDTIKVLDADTLQVLSTIQSGS